MTGTGKRVEFADIENEEPNQAELVSYRRSKRKSLAEIILTGNGQLAEDYDWLRRDSFLHELQSEVDPDIIQEEINRLEEKKPKTCRRRMVRILKSTPVVSILLFLIIVDAAIVLTQLVLDIQASYEDFAEMKAEANTIMVWVNATHWSQLEAADYDGSNATKIMEILATSSNNVTGACFGGARRRLLAAPPPSDGVTEPGKFIFKAGHSYLHDIVHILHLVSIVILGILMIEVILKIIGLGLDFLKYKIEVIDAIIVTASFILDIVFLNSNMTKTISVMIILILWRVVRLLNAVIVQEKQRLKFLLRVTKASNNNAKQRIAILNDSLKAKHQEIQTLRNLCSILGGSAEPPLKQSKKPPVVKKKRPSSGLSPLLMSALSATTLGLLPSVNNNNNGSNSASNSPFSTPFAKRKNKSKVPPRVHSLSTSAIDCSNIGKDDQQISDKLKLSKSGLNGTVSASVDNLSPPPDYNSIMNQDGKARANGSACKSAEDSVSDNASEILINSSNHSTPPRKDRLNLLIAANDTAGIDNEAFAQSPEIIEQQTTSAKRSSLLSWFFPKKKVKHVIPEVRVIAAAPATNAVTSYPHSLRESKSDSELMSTPDRSRKYSGVLRPTLTATTIDDSENEAASSEKAADSESERSSIKSDLPVFRDYNSSLSSASSSTGSFSRACLQQVSKISGDTTDKPLSSCSAAEPLASSSSQSKLNEDAFPLLTDTMKRAAEASTSPKSQSDDALSLPLSDSYSPVKIQNESKGSSVQGEVLPYTVGGRTSPSGSDVAAVSIETTNQSEERAVISSFVIDIDSKDNSKSNNVESADNEKSADSDEGDDDEFCMTKL